MNFLKINLSLLCLDTVLIPLVQFVLTMMEQMRIGIMGHSFVKHFRDFVNRDHKVDVNLNLSDTRVHFFGRGGLTLDRIKELEHNIRQWGQADIVILILGDNDVGRSLSPSKMANEIIVACEKVKKWTGSPRIVVLSMFPRFWKPCHHYFVQDYNQQAAAVNSCLQEVVDNERGNFVWSCNSRV